MTLAVIDSADQSASHVPVLHAGVPTATAKLTIMCICGASFDAWDVTG